MLEIIKEPGPQWPSHLPEVPKLYSKKEMFLYKIQLLTLLQCFFKHQPVLLFIFRN